MTLTEKIEKLIGEDLVETAEVANAKGYNQAKAELRQAIPEIIKVLREDVLDKIDNYADTKIRNDAVGMSDVYIGNLNALKIMSNYLIKAKRPKGTKWEEVEMLDNYWGRHRYGVRFPDGQIYKEEDCKIKL